MANSKQILLLYKQLLEKHTSLITTTSRNIPREKSLKHLRLINPNERK